jgi:hypothetical protein
MRTSDTFSTVRPLHSASSHITCPTHQFHACAEKVADPTQKFCIWFRTRIRPEVSLGSGSGSKSKSGFESGTESWIRIQIRNWTKLPSLSSVPWLQTRCAINLQDSDPDRLVRGTDRGSGSVPKCHGSKTLRTTVLRTNVKYV